MDRGTGSRGARYSFDSAEPGRGGRRPRTMREGRACTTGVEALRRLARVGISPVVTVVEHEEALEGRRGTREFRNPARPGSDSRGIASEGRSGAPRISGERGGWGNEAPGPEIEGVPSSASQPDRHARGDHDLPDSGRGPEASLGETLPFRRSAAISLNWRACHTACGWLRCAT